MATNLQIDDKLLAEVVKYGKHRTKREAVNTALAEYLKMLQRKELINLFGKIDFHPEFLAKHSPKPKKRSSSIRVSGHWRSDESHISSLSRSSSTSPH